MASPKRVDVNLEPDASDFAFPAAGELNPGKAKDFPVNPTSSEVVAMSNKLKEEEVREQKKKKKEKEKKEAAERFKSTIIMSGMVVAVVGAIFAITNKLREK
uniref:Transmembrane protein n=1 Tax=Nelumbo nucifera TaxID=4432 RepID=A0A822ZVJ2_NELNU|nr:TPA_asm: hypothetical protein HUJ06_018457 [Nelumbo nucifera]